MAQGDDALAALREAMKLSPGNAPLRLHLAETQVGAVGCAMAGIAGREFLWLAAAFCLLVLTQPVSVVFRLPQGWSRGGMALYTLGLAAVATVAWSSIYLAEHHRGNGELAASLAPLFGFGVLFSGLVANALLGMRIKR